MSVLTGPQIEKERADGRLLIEPFDPSQLKPNSYDVRLGAEFLHHPVEDDGTRRLFVPSSKSSVSQHWRQGTPVTWQEFLSTYGASRMLTEDEINDHAEDLPLDTRVIPLMPGETILATTEEFIGSVPNAPITTKMQARSSTGRSWLSVCKCAGLGDVGYCNRWAMEIKNESPDLIIPLVVGQRLAQIVFMYTKGDIQNYTGKYQASLSSVSSVSSMSSMSSSTEHSLAAAQKIYEQMRADWTVERLRPHLEAE